MNERFAIMAMVVGLGSSCTAHTKVCDTLANVDDHLAFVYRNLPADTPTEVRRELDRASDKFLQAYDMCFEDPTNAE